MSEHQQERELHVGNPGRPVEEAERTGTRAWPYNPTQPQERVAVPVEAAPIVVPEVEEGQPEGSKGALIADDGTIPANPTIEQRIYAVARWAAALALVEMRDGPDHALVVRDAGPDQFLCSEAEWERINSTSKMGINYVLYGEATEDA